MTAKKAPAQLQPPDYEPADAYAFQALARGDASPELQKRALRWLIEKAAASYDLSFSHENHSLTDFAEGRRFVGLQVIKLLQIDTNKLSRTTHG